MPVQEIPRVSENINFAETEEKILNFWKDIDAFQNCLKQSRCKPRYTFYDGPPFATGLPHYGHILAGTIKDVVTRYAHQTGHHVVRRFGWDCHGLPIEFEIDNMLGIKTPEDVMKIGIKKYNEHCRSIVTRYCNEWETIIGRIGRWIDFKNDYKTMYPWFMETVWWIFKQLYTKGFVYQGNKVMPYSTACNTPLSNFESGQNYKEVVDPAITVALPLIDDKGDASLLIWTTTPWTLPSNMAACVNPVMIYARVEVQSSGRQYILLQSRLEIVFGEEKYVILDTFPGISLKDKQYKPPFNYFEHLRAKRAFRVLVDDYVSDESGTGIVHQAPYFGEDDHRVCLNAGLITKEQDPICPIDASGRFKAPVVDFEGMYVKDADKNIIAKLKAIDRLFSHKQVKHSYPYCWRSDTPLIYRAVPSWFIRVEHMTEDLVKSSSATYWVPENVRDKRFGNWLRDARDWAISRNRYWGTPIPIWMSEDGEEIVVIGCIEELEDKTGVQITDLHRESIDHLTIPSARPGKPDLVRIPEVFDCWFESGAMPYAQVHFPFDRPEELFANFPADFIAEGIDQTRGWFYTLTVIATALFGRAPFKNLIANGLVLAGDGQKMSKRKRNYPDPMEIVKQYGADALRLYLISSPVVRAENLRFKESGVRDILKDVFLPWYNAFRFLLQNIECYVQQHNEPFHYDEKVSLKADNIMDKWILSFTQSLLDYVRKEMAVYHLYNVVPRLTKFIDYLTNWYVRMNRKRFKGEGGKDDCYKALQTLFNVVLSIVRIMSPFAPFLTETMYQNLKTLTTFKLESVHYLMLPEVDTKLISSNIERAVSRLQTVIELGRVIRDRKAVPIKYPLPQITIVHKDPSYLDDIKGLQDYVFLELNVRKIETSTDIAQFGLVQKAEPDYRKLGSRLKTNLTKVVSAIQALSPDEINDFQKEGFKEFAGERVELDEIKILFQTKNIDTKCEVNSDSDVVVLLDMTPDQSMLDEGLAREIINRVQKLRKKAGLVPVDEVSVFYKCDDNLERVAKEYEAFISNTIKSPFKNVKEMTPVHQVVIEETQKLKEWKLQLVLTRKQNVVVPVVKWVNVQLVGFCSCGKQEPKFTKGLILLEVANIMISLNSLLCEVSRIFQIKRFELVTQKRVRVTDKDIPKLSGQTIFALKKKSKAPLPESTPFPFCQVVNFKQKGVAGTLILENPAGGIILPEKERKNLINQWLQIARSKEKTE